MLVDAFHLLADNAAAILPIGGFLIGFTFGAIVIATNFCTMGAISDIVAFGDYRRFRSWVLAAAVALAGVQTLIAAGLLDLDQSLYLRGGLHWFGSIAGGLIFGFGMVLAGGCPSRNLARAGAGDLRALMTVVVLGLAAYTTMGGLLGPLRQLLDLHTTVTLPAATTSSLADLVAFAAGVRGVGAVRTAAALLLVATALVYCFASPQFRASPRHVFAGMAIGSCAIAGWLVTTYAQDEFAAAPVPPTSLSFVRPVAENLDYLMRFTAMGSMGFGTALVLGSIAGAMAVAVLTRSFRLQGFSDTADITRNLAGAALMGVGGVFALGCSIGQGVTGISTMAAGSFLAFAAMATGAVAGVKYLASRV